MKTKSRSRKFSWKVRVLERPCCTGKLALASQGSSSSQQCQHSNKCK